MSYLLPLVASTFIIRMLTIMVLPLGAYSLDLRHYLEVQEILDRAGNPYVDTSYLNYGPLWVQVLWVLRRMSDFSGIPREIMIKLFNVLADTVSAALIYSIGCRVLEAKRVFWLVFFGFVVNPVLLTLTCLHGSFDSLVMALLLATVDLLFRGTYHQAGQNYWFGSCLVLGYGIIAKTVPVLAFPLLLTEWVKKRWSELLLGAAIFLTPIMVGFSTLYALFPVDVKLKVFNYTSVPGYFGFTGIFRLVGLGEGWDADYAGVFKCVLLLVFLIEVFFTVVVDRNSSTRPPVELLVLNFLFLVVFGPGFGPQYLLWICPLVLVQLLLGANDKSSSKYRLGAYFFYVVASFTVPFEYLRSSSLAGALATPPNAVLGYQQVQANSTILRLPLFLSMLYLFRLQLVLVVRLFRANGASLTSKCPAT
jgi:hypothetical protein